MSDNWPKDTPTTMGYAMAYACWLRTTKPWVNKRDTWFWAFRYIQMGAPR